MSKINDLLKNCYRKEDIDTKIIFYQTPKFLIHSDKYKDLGLAEKLVYSVLRDRLELSINNTKEDFVDANGYVFIRFDQEKLGDLLNINKKTVGRYMKSLEEHKLIVIIREGRGRSNRIYITDISKQLEEIYTYENDKKDMDIEKENVAIDEENIIEEIEELEEIKAESIEDTLKGQNVTSRSDKMPSLEVTKSPQNDTNIINTDFIETVNQSIENDNNINKIKKIDRQIDIPNKQLNKYEETIKKCEINHIEEQYRDAVTHAIKLLFLDIENKKRINIGDNIIPAKIVRNDLEKLNFFVIEHAINKFKESARERDIKNTVAYLKACIYNSIHEMKLDVDSELRYEGLI